MVSPFKSWCYNCSSFSNARIQYRTVPAPGYKERGRAKTKLPFMLQYKITCPGCGGQMVPDKKIQQVLNLVKYQFHKGLFTDLEKE